MTTDIERELRELFHEKAHEAPVATFGASGAAPQEILRRGRRRQVGTVLGSAAIVLVLIVGSVAGLNALLRGEGDPFRTGEDYTVFERTATVEAFTVTSPSDWYLVSEWPLSMQTAVSGSASASGECTAAAPGAGQPSLVCTTSEPSPQVEALPHGLPMFQLSNIDLGLNIVSCGQDLPTNAAVLYMGLDYQRAIFGAKDPSIGPWPVELREPEAAGGPCGAGRYAAFSVNGEPFFAWIGFGSSVTDADRSTALAAYKSMIVDDAWEPTPPEYVTPAYVIAGGTRANGDPWRLDLRPGERSPELSLEGVDPSFVGVDPREGHDTVVPAIPIEICCGWTDGLGDTVFVDVTFGFVRQGATGVELQVREGDDLTGQVLSGTVVPVPPSLGSFGSDLFFIPGTSGLAGEVVPIGIEGSAESPPPVAGPRTSVVDLRDTFEGHAWTARFRGGFEDGPACIDVTIDGRVNPGGPSCRIRPATSWAGDQPSLDSWVFHQMYIGAGSVPSDIFGIRFRSDDRTRAVVDGVCESGPIGWIDHNVCAIALPPEGSGTLEFLDAGGQVLFDEGDAWSQATAASNELQWTNEGTTITAIGSFHGTEWKLEVLHYLEGYRLTIGPGSGRKAFEGRLSEGEPVVIPFIWSEAGNYDAIILVLSGTDVERLSVMSGTTWEGRWAPGSTANGAEARLWVIEVPGAGSGSLLMDGVDRGNVSWP
jgi:hypothetical protein